MGLGVNHCPYCLFCLALLLVLVKQSSAAQQTRVFEAHETALSAIDTQNHSQFLERYRQPFHPEE